MLNENERIEFESPYFEMKYLCRTPEFIEISQITGADEKHACLKEMLNMMDLELLEEGDILDLQTNKLIEKGGIKNKLQQHKLKLSKLSDKQIMAKVALAKKNLKAKLKY